MKSRRKAKKGSKNDDFELIKDVIDSNDVSIADIKNLATINYPVFSFKYLQDVSIKDCNDVKFVKDFIFRLKQLSELGWIEIRKSGRHSFGMEKIPYHAIKPNIHIPGFITPEVEFCVFRATGSNLPFIGIQEGRIFHIVFIETRFGDIYNH